MSPGAKTAVQSITYNVAEGLKFADFNATVTMTSGKGQVKVTQTSFSNQKLIVKFLYEAAASDWECESYTSSRRASMHSPLLLARPSKTRPSCSIWPICHI